MSHWRSHKSNVLEDVNMDMLRKACADIGVGMDTNTKSISNSWGKETVDAAITKNGKTLALGFVFETAAGKTALKLTGDFYSTGLDEATFIDRLAQQYMKYKATAALEAEGFTVDSIDLNTSGNIEIMATPWGEF